ncbi:ATP-binding cassette sub-family G member 1 [Anoplophora glabripennis]|uniref:ATP-binding cassette sub-family G member 1 n=1 Tax=Anoplophora glabripennis TaxID=217634 RepID=UPI0008751A62|nr:ATP-binding cassette sub-family G member 1 [Anoplophora glabripennis]
MDSCKIISQQNLKYLPKRPPVNIEFQDLTYNVPHGRKGSKMILRSVSGEFRSGQLNAILGPSGAGKSTLLNILAGYKCRGATGSVLINGEPRNLKQFRKMSRYIMQDDLMQPMLTVDEAMLVAANLKLGRNLSHTDKMNAIMEILELLRLSGTRKTPTNLLSGGERKRLSIALELLNNPPVLFLDEPTTGLDDLSCSQCISLLKQIADGGRTVICSIHTPSAKLFSVFDNVYIIAAGQCVYQGYGPEVVPFLSNLGVECPKHYNPADFIIEVCCMEYGDYHDRMVAAVDNGRINCNNLCRLASMEEVSLDNSISSIKEDPLLSEQNFNHESGWLRQFYILIMRMWLQMWRDKCYLLLRVILYIAIGILIGNLYIGMGQDGSKTIFNFGFYFTCLIFFMYIPMMPILSQFPREVQLVKREHFNKWYRLSAYFAALTFSTIPIQVLLGTLYVVLVCVLSDQPMELDRLLMFYLVCMLTGVISESLGLLIGSQLTIVNAMFVGPVVTVPIMLLAVYGFGSGYDTVPTLIKIAMYFSYLRYSLEGLIHSMLQGRKKLDCPESEDFCIYTDLQFFVKEMGMENTVYWLDIAALVFIYILFRGGSYYLLRQRLCPSKTFLALQYIGRFVKSHFGMSR